MKKLSHWADQTVENILRSRGEKELYTCASGISPSGHVHIGNFREVITTEFVVTAFEKRGHKVRFIYSWDDYDRLRKIPEGINTDFQKYLGKPYSEVPDPQGAAESWALNFEKEFENSLAPMGINVEYLRQSVLYKSCIYSDGIKKALVQREKIKIILDKFRKTPLDNSFFPLSIYCEKCGKDDTKVTAYNEDTLIDYNCLCGHIGQTDFSKNGNVKLPWRIDWPMRWAFNKVDFEPGGKDHSSDGGSYDTSKIIAKEIFNIEPPYYLMYDFIGIKGTGGKISSSKGGVITLADALEIYEPEMIRYLFASYKTNVEFDISFDLDAIKFYEDYDRTERKYYGLETANEKQKEQIDASWRLAQISGEPNEKPPFRASFRHLCNVLQIHDLDLKKTSASYKENIQCEADERALNERMPRAVNWLKLHAPEDFKYEIRTAAGDLPVSEVLKNCVIHFKTFLNSSADFNEKSVSEAMYRALTETNADHQEFFQLMYQLLISKNKGPKLASFIAQIGAEKLLFLLSAIKV